MNSTVGRTGLRVSRALRAPTATYNAATQRESNQIQSSILGAFRGSGARRASGVNSGEDDTEARNEEKKGVLKRGANRDPELYPTSSSSEQTVSMADNSKPWESGTSGKYQYHPGGDRTKAPKDAPSALHSVIVPNVTLPKKLHDQFNKYDKEEFDDY
ncbi:MAG: hypothetical protein M1828_006990 [Chrysothrix sp. TS-e1954]|nr:MAG: hypothetical protein M1828_006990 [Chrysothrix sp. TS-e1954]